MGIRISSAILTRIMRSTAIGPPGGGGWGPPHEKCGILRGRGDRIAVAEPAANVSPWPETMFEIDPRALLAAYRLQRRSRALEVLGFYHTHPAGDPFPSVRDAACAAPDGKLWLIATATHARLWRAAGDGAVHGRFDPVRFDLQTGKRVEKDILQVQHGAVGRTIPVRRDPEMPS